LRTVALGIAGAVILTVGALTMLLVAVVTLFQTRRFCSEVIARFMGFLAVRLSGVRMVVHRDEPLPKKQTVFISNHTSTLDVFVVTALGLPRTRYFLSGFLRKIVPLGLVGYLIGVFWTVPYRFPDKRRKIFQRADRVLPCKVAARVLISLSRAGLDWDSGRLHWVTSSTDGVR